MASIDLGRALTFDKVAEEYARWRPDYPAEAVAWLAPTAPTAPARVAELGAGTGKLTASLIKHGLHVEAIEPDANMLTVLTRGNPSAAPHGAPSDSLPFPDATLDAVLVADAWHWFPIEATTAEVRRILKPGGWLGLVWNLVTPVEPWEFEVAGIDPDQKGVRGSGQPSLAPSLPGHETDVAAFPWTWEITPEHYAANLATNSAVVAMSAEDRHDRMEAARALLQRVCDETARSKLPFSMPPAACDGPHATELSDCQGGSGLPGGVMLRVPAQGRHVALVGGSAGGVGGDVVAVAVSGDSGAPGEHAGVVA